MREKLYKLKKNPFIRNVTIVASGTIIAQLIAIAFTPLITRLYGPEAFGVLGVFTASSAIIITIGSLTYQIAIVLPKKDDDAKALAVLSIMVATVLSLLLALILFLFRTPIISLLHLESISSFIFLIPVFIFFASWHKIVEQWIIRTKQFEKKARLAIVQALVINSTKSGIGLFYPAAVVLVILTTLGPLLHALMLSWTFSKKIITTFHNLKSIPWLTISRIKEVARRHKDFPVYRAPQAFVGTITNQIPIIIIASLFGPVNAGLYTLGQKMIKAPSSIISEAVGKVFYPWISQEFNEGKSIRHLLIKTTLGLAAIGIIPFGTIIIFGPTLFGFIFGNEWVAAGEYARWISVWFFFEFIRVPSLHAIPVISLQGFFLLYEIISTLIRISTLLITANITQNDILTIAYFCGASALLTSLLVIAVILKSNKTGLK